MLKFKNVTIRNFLSVGAITQAIQLDDVPMSLIIAENTDNGGSNGTGKTVSLQALSYAWFGQPITPIRIDLLINNLNLKNCLVTSEIEKDGVLIRVERGRKPNVLRLFVNNVERKEAEVNEALGENKNTQKEVERIIGMSHSMFLNIVALNTSTTPFLRMKAAEQRDMIEELLGIRQLTERAEALKLVISETKENIRDKETSLSATLEANNRIEAAIKKVSESSQTWIMNHEHKIKMLNEEVEEVSKIDFEAEASIFDKIDAWVEQEQSLQAELKVILKDIETLRKEITTLEKDAQAKEKEASTGQDSQISRLETEASRHALEAKSTCDVAVKRLEEELVQIKANSKAKTLEIVSFETDLAQIRSEIDNSDAHSCSTCGQGLSGTDHLETVLQKLKAKETVTLSNIGRLVKSIETYEKNHKAIETDITELKISHELKVSESDQKHQDTLSQISEIREAHALKQASLIDDALTIRSEISAIEIALETMEMDASEFRRKITILGCKPESSFKNKEAVWKLRESRDIILREIEAEEKSTNPHLIQIETMKSTISPLDYETLNALILTQKHQEFLLKLLVSKSSFIRKKIIEKSLRDLNSRMNFYLEALKLPHEVKFLPDLTVEIMLLGRPYDFEQLSTGERNRVILATSWSFRDVWEAMNQTINLLFLDEVADVGMDLDGAEAALVVLENMARDRKKNVFLISHKEALIGRASRVLLVKKRDGFTSFEEDGSL